MANAVWDAAWNRAQPQLRQAQINLAQSHAVPPRIIRVGQLDSELLDQELSNLLQEPVAKALAIANVRLHCLRSQACL